MARYSEIATSSIFLKIIMSATGIILIAFVAGHLAGNLQLFIGKETYNRYAHFLQSLGEILWIIRGALLIALIVHIWVSIVLKVKNLCAKPNRYAVKSYAKAELSSRTMIWTGAMIGCFLTYHLLHLTFRITHPELNGMLDSLGNIDIYSIVVKSFQIPILSALYIVSLGLLGYHLHHAIESFFQTLGLKNERFSAIIVSATKLIAYLITAGYIMIPIGVIIGLIKA